MRCDGLRVYTNVLLLRAGDRVRTGDVQLGRLTLYQLSYSRDSSLLSSVSRAGPWRVMDSNHRRHSRQIYSLLPLATRVTLRIICSFLDFASGDDELTRGLEPL